MLVSLFIEDAHTPRIAALLRQARRDLVVSTFAAAEFAAAVGRRVRMRDLTNDQGGQLLALFGAWTSGAPEVVEVESEDHRVAAGFVRRFEIGLAAPDALHIAICRRLGLPLLTFDQRQAAAAIALGVACDPAGAPLPGPAGRPA